MDQHRHTFAFVLCAALTIAGRLYAATPQYTLTDLGAFQPTAIAGSWVVGHENGLPVRLNRETGQKTILDHGGQGGIAQAVLSSGVTVGTTIANGVDAATVWDAQGQAFLLPGPSPSYGMAINDAGTMAGHSSACPGGQQAMRWWPAGPFECLPGEPGHINVGSAIDGQHRIWGRVDNPRPKVAVWDVNQGLILLDGPQFYTNTTASAVTPDGVVVGLSGPAFLGTIENGLIALPMNPPGALECSALDINQNRVVVGSCDQRFAVLWPDPETALVLQDLIMPPIPGLILRQATGVSDDGEIVGTGPMGGYLLTPICTNMAMTSSTPVGNCADSSGRHHLKEQ